MDGDKQVTVRVIVFPYASLSSRREALASLRNLRARVRKVTVLVRHSPAAGDGQGLESATGLVVEYRLLNSFKECLEESAAKDEYCLFLYDEDFVAKAPDLTLVLNHNETRMLVCPVTFGKVVFYRPTLVHARTLVQRWGRLASLGPLVWAHPESALAACRSQFFEHEVAHLADRVIRQRRRVNQRSHLEYLESLGAVLPYVNPVWNRTLSVVLANYNMGNFIDKALASFAAQYVPAHQVLVIDDGSTDNSARRVKTWLPQVPDMELHVAVANRGKAAALNAILPFLTSDFTLEVDADDWLDPGAIQQIRHQLSELPDKANLLYGNLRTWTLLRNGTYRCIGTHAGRVLTNLRELLRYPFPLGPRIYRTEVLRELGGFPVSPYQNGKLYEDVLVLKRLMEAGEIKYANFTVYNNLRHADSITQRNHAHWKPFVAEEFGRSSFTQDTLANTTLPHDT